MYDTDPDDEDLGDFDADAFDVSDVQFEIAPSKRNKVVLIARSEVDFNLMRYYLALKSYVEKIETEMGVMAESGQEH